MNSADKNGWSAGLPYVNNAAIILLTLAINLAAVFIFMNGEELTLRSILTDAGICGITTSFIDVFAVKYRLDKLREMNALPASVPKSGLMARLPSNPLALAFVFAAAFCLLSPLFNWLLIRFYGIETFTFPRFLAWRLAYSCALSAKLVELAVLRFVQPDCCKGQSGAQEVKNPLPRLSTLKNLFDTVVNDFGFNMLAGLLLGGTVVVEHRVVIAPTTRAGIIVSAVILSVIVTARMVYPVAKSIDNEKRAGRLPGLAAGNAAVCLLPCTPAMFALALMPVIMLASVSVLWSALTFFGFEVLDFFQYFVIRTLYVTLLSKCVVRLALLRWMQPGEKKPHER